jgi:predicted nucleic acid-binding protein
MSQNICTSQELKDFATTSEITINELSKFIESKTSQQYVIVQKDFVKAISKQLFNNTLHIFDINKFLNDVWSKIVTENQATTDKWKNELNAFEDSK